MKLVWSMIGCLLGFAVGAAANLSWLMLIHHLEEDIDQRLLGMVALSGMLVGAFTGWFLRTRYERRAEMKRNPEK